MEPYPPQLSTTITDYFKNIFTAHNNLQVDWWIDQQQHTTTEHTQVINTDEYTSSTPDMQDLQTIIHQMRSDASPGPDGLNAAFYKASWSWTKQDIHQRTIGFPKPKPKQQPPSWILEPSRRRHLVELAMAPPVAAVRHPQPLLRLGGLLPSSPTTLPFASRGTAASARIRLPPPRFSLSPVPKSLSSTTSQVPVQSLFTGIVEEVGTVRRLGPPLVPSGGGGEAPGLDLEVESKKLIAGTQLGDSVAVDGTCLTVAAIDPAASTLTFGVAPETLRRTSLGARAPGDGVNLERALTPASRMGGHFVQGHVDGTGEIAEFRLDGDALWVTVRAPPEIVRLLVPKGFVAVDGTSLTVCNVDDQAGWFDFMLVRYTQDNVVLPTKKVGDKVNLEADILGKYVEKLLAGRMEVMSKADS